MSVRNSNDGSLLAPPFTHKSARNSQNGTQTIVIEPTPEYQEFYNANRREMDRQRLEDHVTEENNLEPPKAQSMSRSTTASDSVPSPSTVCSHGGDGSTPFASDNSTEAVKSRPQRGKRTGPLQMEKRYETAFKRKFKLTCQYHRTKKTSCNCHSFDKLEDAYNKSRNEGQNTRASRGQSVRPLGDLGTFGAGGVAPATIPCYQNFDFLSDLPTGHELTPQVHANLRPALDFDIQSAASINAIVTAPHEAPFYLGLPPMSRPVEFAIGSSMPFRNRWECRYEHTTEETRSLASTGPCSWTGPLEQLEEHFTTEHHSFHFADTPRRSICSGCEAVSFDWVDERACIEPEKCLPDDWQKWLFGRPVRQSRTLPSELTVSEASGSRSLWHQPSWNMGTSGSSNTENSNFPYGSYTGHSGFYEQLARGDESREAEDGKGIKEAYHECEELPSRCGCWFAATNTTPHYCIRGRLPFSRWKSEHRSALYDSRLNLPSRLKPGRHLILSLLAPLVFFHLLGNNVPIHLSGILLVFSTSACCLKWYLALTILGSLVAWVAMGSLRSTPYRDNGLHTLAPVV